MRQKNVRILNFRYGTALQNIGGGGVFKLSRLKTKYMEYKLGKNASVDDTMVKLEDQATKNKNHCRYLGSITQKDEEINEIVTHRIEA